MKDQTFKQKNKYAAYLFAEFKDEKGNKFRDYLLSDLEKIAELVIAYTDNESANGHECSHIFLYEDKIAIAVEWYSKIRTQESTPAPGVIIITGGFEVESLGVKIYSDEVSIDSICERLSKLAPILKKE